MTTYIKTYFVNSNFTVDWFHVVKLFSKAVDEVRCKEAKEARIPRTARWAPLKAAESDFTEKQLESVARYARRPDRTKMRCW